MRFNFKSPGWPNFTEVVAFFCFVLIVSVMTRMDYLESMPWIANTYKNMGFEWRRLPGDRFSTILTVALVNSVLYLGIRTISQGWPVFQNHDYSSFQQSLFRTMAYGFLLIVGIGLYGQKLEAMSVISNPFEFLISMLVALIFSGITVLLDDVVSATYQITFTKRGNQ